MTRAQATDAVKALRRLGFRSVAVLPDVGPGFRAGCVDSGQWVWFSTETQTEAFILAFTQRIPPFGGLK